MRRPARADDRPARRRPGPPAPTSRTARSSGPSVRRSGRCPTTILADLLGPAHVRGRPPAARPRRPRLDVERRLDRRPRHDRPRAAPGADARGHPRPARPARASGTRSCSSSRTSIAPMPRPGRSSRSWPGSRATSGWPSSGTHQPTSSRRDDPWPADLDAIATGPRPPDRLDAPAARSRRAGRADRGDRGRARVGQPAARSSPSDRAVCRSSPRSCWPPGGSSRARR